MAHSKKEQIEDPVYGKLLLDWTFPEYAHHNRSFKWYFLISLIFLLVIIYSFITGNFLFVVFLIIFAVIIFSSDHRSPRKVSFTIFEDGIKVGENKFYNWSDIKNFHLVYQPPQTTRLYIDLKNMILSDLSVPLEGKDPLKIRKILKEYLEEDLDKENETLMDRLNRWLRI